MADGRHQPQGHRTAHLTLITGALALAAAVGLCSLDADAPTGNGELLSSVATISSFVSPRSIVVVACGGLLIAAIVAAGESVSRQLRASRGFIQGLDRVGEISRATVVRDARALAFCAGTWRPRVFVSTGTVALLDPDELRAVLAHEASHRRRFDPLRVLVVRALADALFFLPGLRSVAGRYEGSIEIAADRAAIAELGGNRGPLASALLRFDERASSTVIGLDPRRVDRLCGEQRRWRFPLILLGWTMVVAGAGAAVIAQMGEVRDAFALSLPPLAAHLCLALAVVAPMLVIAGAVLRLGSALGVRKA